MIKSCNCESDSSLMGVSFYFDRPRFFPRQMVGPEDLNDLLEYTRQKSRLRNRMLFGWGVVCGAIVKRSQPEGAKKDRGQDSAPDPGDSQQPSQVSVTPGFILGPYGDEIYIPTETQVDLRSCGVTVDPECPPEQRAAYQDVSKEETRTVYIAVRYDEQKTQWKKAEPAGCGCDPSSCEHTRVRDWFEIRCLTYCPNPCRPAKPTPDDRPSGDKMDSDEKLIAYDKLMTDIQRGEDEGQGCEFDRAACPPCADEPWVPLAAVELDKNGKITRIRNCRFSDSDDACRRPVVKTLGSCCCSGPEKELDETPSEPADDLSSKRQ